VRKQTNNEKVFVLPKERRDGEERKEETEASKEKGGAT